MTPKPIAIIGSLNVDFITRTPRMPEAGETLAVHSFSTGFGGKGANQAVACARLSPPGAQIHMVGNVGDDSFGADYFKALQREGINTSQVRKLPGQSTGVANIIVEENTGENRILFAANANYDFAEKSGGDWELVPETAEVVVFQLEIPMRVVLHNVRRASEAGKHVIMNPAPATPLPDDVFPHIDTLVLNETESAILAGSTSHASPADLCSYFLGKGVKDAVIITLGGEGLAYATSSGASGRLAAEKVNVLDTTAAGDTFVGGYAVRIAGKTVSEEPFNYEAALQFASLAAAKSVTKAGAMDAIPYLRDL